MRKSVLAVFAVMTAAVSGCGVENRAPEYTPEESAGPLIHVNSREEFRENVLESDMPCLADFFSQSCPPCRQLSPVIKKLAAEYEGKAFVCKVSLDHPETRHFARQYRIIGLPAALFFMNGIEIHRVTGLREQAEYEKVLDSMIERVRTQSEGENENAGNKTQTPGK